MSRGKVLVGMSGGVDSACAVRLLLEAGYEAVGAVLVFSPHTDIEPALRAARELGVRLVVEDVQEEFRRQVISDFVAEYAAGRTPNPCVLCNRSVKMETLLRLSYREKCDFFATGHYVRVASLANRRFALGRAADFRKDQSYMLWGMTQEQLSRFMAPLAELTKDSVLGRAQNAGLSSAGAGESQDICFIPDGDYISFLLRNGAPSEAFAPGDFVGKDGRFLGRHEGIARYTVGQRKGLGIALGYPAFVTAIDPETKKITLSPKEGCLSSSMKVDSPVFQGMEKTEGRFLLKVKIRYAAPPVPCEVTIAGEKIEVFFEEPQRCPAPGQSAVFYRDDLVMFGGRILG